MQFRVWLCHSFGRTHHWLLADAAEEEDFKEAILAYSFLLKCPAGLSASALDAQIEAWFQEQYQSELDFEISDALAKLEGMHLVELTGEVYRALPLDKAKQVLDSHWDNIFNYA